MWYIALLILFGVLFLVTELVLLPGVSVGALLSLVCYGAAIYLGFTQFGTTTGVVVIVVILILSLLATILSLRAKTWQRFSLKQEIRSSSMPTPSDELVVGDRGVTLSRLAPMGKVVINDRQYEAKTTGSYIDAQTPIEVIGFENFNVIVKKQTK
ncbi:MAG: serine protease [Alistipes sp.]|nr:serine protease [Alistipes sp.]MBQ1938889.1 serine protease [Alistipes sp.]MBQ5879937.1 serine protease [Alistipes sp.]MBR0331294.1 serine protease [Alistipes sp.]